jgi:hypothetical protein
MGFYSTVPPYRLDMRNDGITLQCGSECIFELIESRLVFRIKRICTCVCGQLIVRNAGKDVSHWFEPRSFLTDELQVVMYFHPVMRINTFYTPLVQFLPSVFFCPPFYQIDVAY